MNKAESSDRELSRMIVNCPWNIIFKMSMWNYGCLNIVHPLSIKNDWYG